MAASRCIKMPCALWSEKGMNAPHAPLLLHQCIVAYASDLSLIDTATLPPEIKSRLSTVHEMMASRRYQSPVIVAMSSEIKDAYSYPRTLLNYKVFDRWVGALPACMYSFIDAINEKREPFVTARDGRKVTAILEAIHRSLSTGKPEKVF